MVIGVKVKVIILYFNSSLKIWPSLEINLNLNVLKLEKNLIFQTLILKKSLIFYDKCLSKLQ